MQAYRVTGQEFLVWLSMMIAGTRDVVEVMRDVIIARELLGEKDTFRSHMSEPNALSRLSKECLASLL